MERKVRQQTTVTIDRAIYEYAKEMLAKHRDKLRILRIKSVSDLFEESVLYFINTYLEPENKASLAYKFRIKE